VGALDLLSKWISKAFQRPKLRRKTVIITLALVAIFVSAIMMRIYPAQYGFYLHEFDPYYDYRATDFLVTHFDQKGLPGFLDYFSWTDYNTWYPEGRAVASTSQEGLHFVGAITYLVARSALGISISLYDYLVLFPVFVGALSALAIYLLVKRVSSSSAGLLAALVIAFSPPIIQRGALGWFKSEPLALFLVILGSYFFLTIYDEKASKIGQMCRASIAGILLGVANTAWGGSMYFNAVFGALLFLTPFLKVDLRRTVHMGSLFVAFNLVFSSIFPRPGPEIISGPAGLALLGGLLFATVSYGIKGMVNPRHYFRTLIKVIFVFALIVGVIASLGAVSGLSGRYQTVIDPFFRTGNPLVESVAEHQSPTGAEYLSSYFALAFLAGFGAIMTIRKRSIYAGFTLVMAISSLYISGSFARLMVYSSVAFAILAGIGLHELSSTIFRPASSSSVKKRFRLGETRIGVKVAYAVFIIAIISFPVAYPSQRNWLETADVPVSIASASTNFRTTVPDWLEALAWMKHSTPEFQPDGKPTVIAAWWDYGYWITVMGNRTSLADNATINTTRIARIGQMFISDEETGLKILKELKADYVAIFVVGQAFTQQDLNQRLYFLGNAGDESKKQWFMRIGGFNESQYLEQDEFTPKPYFWDNTFLGKMMPFQFASYVESQGGQLVFSNQTQYASGFQSIYTYDMKYPANGSGPLQLAFMSSSLAEPHDGFFAGVIVYKIVK
jgi:dolichyl-diphosphooligosaccharide--protein glycosyltransferase